MSDPRDMQYRTQGHEMDGGNVRGAGGTMMHVEVRVATAFDASNSSRTAGNGFAKPKLRQMSE
jgi:hypothetical protein